MTLPRAVSILVLAGYLAFFVMTERHFSTAKLHFSAPLPAPVLNVALGFLRHLGAEMLFVKAAVFLGAPPAMLPPEEEYVENLTLNFEVLTDIYPEFRDAGFLAQSSLAHISPEYAGRVIGILDKGIDALPDDLYLPFFKGFNHYYYRGENAHAAEIFAELGQRPDAPSWIGHLAAVLSGQGGDLYAGLVTLQIMHAMEEEEFHKARYARDIDTFQRAIEVYEATRSFFNTFGRYPEELDELIPGFIPGLPDVGPDFELLWIPPKLRLVRPE